MKYLIVDFSFAHLFERESGKSVMIQSRLKHRTCTARTGPPIVMIVSLLPYNIILSGRAEFRHRFSRPCPPPEVRAPPRPAPTHPLPRGNPSDVCLCLYLFIFWQFPPPPPPRRGLKSPPLPRALSRRHSFHFEKDFRGSRTRTSFNPSYIINNK